MQSGKALTWQLEQFGDRSARTGHGTLHHAALPHVCQAAPACLASVPATAFVHVHLPLHMLLHVGQLRLAKGISALSLATLARPMLLPLYHTLPTPAAASAPIQLDTARKPLLVATWGCCSAELHGPLPPTLTAPTQSNCHLRVAQQSCFCPCSRHRPLRRQCHRPPRDGLLHGQLPRAHSGRPGPDLQGAVQNALCPRHARRQNGQVPGPGLGQAAHKEGKVHKAALCWSRLVKELGMSGRTAEGFPVWGAPGQAGDG